MCVFIIGFKTIQKKDKWIKIVIKKRLAGKENIHSSGYLIYFKKTINLYKTIRSH